MTTGERMARAADDAALVQPDRAWFLRDSVALAPLLLGAVLAYESDEGRVAVRLSELEAYRGVGVDPGSHAFRGRTARNAVMFGDGGHLYAYFTYGMHTCLNIVADHAGTSGGVLLRGGTIVEGLDLARSRRPRSTERDLARGPARLAQALGVPLARNGSDLLTAPFELRVPAEPLVHETGPRTGIAGAGGAVEYSWRFWLPGDPGVSVYRRHPKSH
ncbi:DNA-3-methyladenine glycosylase [Agromyces flavus]|uniref:Putative 3-methyladenine DNA glycosylase n=1 Tax=Agromyces flavus TaxID=589382 RepID=A0A1H1SU52_9MICO|nr:DNA-3-methyladenine glycosylase [Agromyces flavus]MCP2369296.1 DNA-3-methyladenine glycosylase [Agromyces flavus]GGI48730.1 putative 3-methyladenine DNA glycosylase [Agromyces flavus]SDS51464.1 DNA-3-methyladenine glycosylase [Agromyces flavus]